MMEEKLWKYQTGLIINCKYWIRSAGDATTNDMMRAENGADPETYPEADPEISMGRR